MVNQDLPEGWAIKTLDEACEIVLGQSPPSETYNSEGKGLPFYQGKAEFGELYPTPVKWCSEPRKIAEADDILISVRAPVGPTNLCQEKSCIGRGLAALRRKDAMPSKYLLYYLRLIESEWDSKATGTTFKAITGDVLRRQQISVAPLPDQERIVARIEELFTQLEAGTSALRRVQAGLKRYKAAVMKAAVEGRLLDGRARVNEGELPEGWRWVTVAELAANELYSITDGPFGSKLKTEHYTESGPRIIRLQNIGDGEFRDAKAYITKEHFATLHRHRIFAGDLVIAGLGESLPRACIIPEYVGDAVVKADCIRFKPNSDVVDTKYLLFALNSETVKRKVHEIVHGIGRPRMNQQEIKAIPIPLPSISEQCQIVAEVDRRLSVAQEIEAVVDASLKRVGRLRQAVLKAAFEGRLVKLNPGDAEQESLLVHTTCSEELNM